MMCLFSFDSGVMYADLNICLVNDGESRNSRTKTYFYHRLMMPGATAVGGMGKGEFKVRCLNLDKLEPPPIDSTIISSRKT